MNTVIIPVDFSETSLNAATYGIKLLTIAPEAEIILYHVYENDNEYENRLEALEKLKEELTLHRTANITVLAERGDFLVELDKLSRHRNAELIIMGLAERSALASFFVGSSALKAAENRSCPVMIIPPNALYSEMKNVLLATDLKNTTSTTPTGPLKKVLSAFKSKLHIVNVNSEHYVALSEEFAAERQKLADMFEEFEPEFYFLRLYNVDEAIKEFAKDKKIDLIITIQKEHSLVYKLFSSDHLKKLATESSVPVMSVHE